MGNEFNKEERIAFESILEGFNDALVLSKNVSTYKTDQKTMERTGDTIWRPQPYIAQSYDGTDMTSNFQDQTQLSVPATIGYKKSVPWAMSATELRDALQEDRLGSAAKQKLASDINVAVNNVAAMQGTLVVKVTAAATGFADVALCEGIMNEQGIPGWDRYLALTTADYNGMAANLADRETFQGDVKDAYRNAFVGRIASFDTYKLDYGKRIAVQGGGTLTATTLAAGVNVYVPKATRVATTGEKSNVDNRYQQITLSATTDMTAGDCFTIATVAAVHQITKESTGNLKTFRCISVDSGTTITISPPLITGQGGTDAELQYQNCTVGTPAANSAIVFLNTVAAPANPFWHKDAIEILPGNYAVPTNAGAAVMKGTTDQGIGLTMQKQYDIDTMQTKYRVDTTIGVVNKAPEMSGIILFNQT